MFTPSTFAVSYTHLRTALSLDQGRIPSVKGYYCGNDHKSRQKSDPRIKDLDLAHGTLQIILFFHIGAIGDHDPHG